MDGALTDAVKTAAEGGVVGLLALACALLIGALVWCVRRSDAINRTVVKEVRTQSERCRTCAQTQSTIIASNGELMRGLKDAMDRVDRTIVQCHIRQGDDGAV